VKPSHRDIKDEFCPSTTTIEKKKIDEQAEKEYAER